MNIEGLIDNLKWKLNCEIENLEKTKERIDYLKELICKYENKI